MRVHLLIYIYLFTIKCFCQSKVNEPVLQILLNKLNDYSLNEVGMKKISAFGVNETKLKLTQKESYLYYAFLNISLQFEKDETKTVQRINDEIKNISKSSIPSKDSLIAQYLLNRSDYENTETANNTINKVKRICENKKIVIDYYYWLYNLYLHNTKNPKFDSVLFWVNSSINISKTLNDSSTISDGFQAKATLSKLKKDYYSTYINYITALKYNTKKNFERAVILNNLSILLSDIGDFDSGIKYAKESILCVSKYPLFNALAHTTMAELYLYNHQYDSIYYYSNKAIDIMKIRSDEKNIIPKNLFYLGVYYYNKHSYDSAKTLFLSSIKKTDDLTLKRYNTQYLVKKSLSNNEFKQVFNDLKEFVPDCRYNAETNIQYNLNIANFYKLLADVCEKIGDLKSTVSYLKEYNAIKDSINIIQMSNKINKAKIYNETNRAQELYNYQKSILQSNYVYKEKQKNYLLIILTSVLVIVVGLGWIYISARKNKIKTNESEANYNLLKAQLNPHFVSNAMSSIQGYILNNDKLIASNYISDFSKLTRLIFEQTSKKYILIEDEITTLNLFFHLQELRFPNSFSYQINRGLIDTDTILIPPMLLQPIIENAIEHNHWKEKKGLININFEILDKDYLLISVTDNGFGLFKNNKKETLGSLEIIAQKIEMINNSERKKGYIVFKPNIPNGLIVNIKTPYKSYE